MDKYIGKYIKVSLPNGFFYKGKVIAENDDLITILDITGKEVMLNLKYVIALEVQE